MNRTEKKDMATSLNEIFTSSQVGLLIDYRGLNVADITELRRQLHESKTSMRILKNRIAKLAIKDTPFSDLEDQLSEPRAFIFSDDPVGPAKVLSKFIGKNQKVSYISGVLVTNTGSKVLEDADMKALGNLPSREELLVQLLYVIQSPPARFVRTLNEIPAKFVRTLAAIAQSKAGN